jgi:hypothetical protein
MSATILLDLLARVKSTGPGRWLAICPAHEDRSPSLSIRELDDGRVLLHDFGGCDTEAVLDALGLEMQALFPERLAAVRSGTGHAPTQSRIPARDLLEAISLEASVVSVVAGDILARRQMSERDWERLRVAVRRINTARDLACGR